MATKKKDIEQAPLVDESFMEIPEDMVEEPEKPVKTRKNAKKAEKKEKPKNIVEDEPEETEEAESAEPVEDEPEEIPVEPAEMEGVIPKNRTIEEPEDNVSPKGRMVVIVDELEAKESKNDVELVGTAERHGVFNNGHSISLTVAIGGAGMSNFPNVIFHGKRTVDAILKIFDGGAKPRVYIKAYIATARKPDDNGVRYFQDIIGRKLCLVPSKLELALSGESGIDDKNEVVFIGELADKFQPNRNANGRSTLTLMTLKTMVHGEHRPNVTLFGRAHDIAQKMKVGDHIAMVGTIQTKRVFEKGKKPVYYQTVVGTHLDWYESLAV